MEQKVAHDEKSKFFILHAKIAYHNLRKWGGIFFLKGVCYMSVHMQKDLKFVDTY